MVVVLCVCVCEEGEKVVCLREVMKKCRKHATELKKRKKEFSFQKGYFA
jgi:hypothetical protein